MDALEVTVQRADQVDERILPDREFRERGRVMHVGFDDGETGQREQRTCVIAHTGGDRHAVPVGHEFGADGPADEAATAEDEKVHEGSLPS